MIADVVLNNFNNEQYVSDLRTTMERVLKRLWVANKLLTIIHQTSVHPIESVDGFRASAYLRFVSFSPGLSIPEGCGGRLSLGHPVTLEILSFLLA